MIKYLPIIIFVTSILIAIILRIVLPWNTIFTPNGVVLTGVDGYYYTHLADLISHNNMQIPQFDPYYDFPNGMDYSQIGTTYNAYGWFIAFIAWVFTLGNISKASLDFISAIHPAILGILALIPIFFITRKLTKNDYMASGALFLGSILAGEYMGRAMLGSTDTHCLEIFLFSFIMMFTVYSLNNGRWKLLWIALTAIFTTFYLIIWQGAIIYLIILTAIGVLWLIWGKLKNTINWEHAVIIMSILALTLVIYLGLSSFKIKFMFILFVPLLAMIAMMIYTFLLQRAKNWIYLTPLTIGAIGVVTIVILSATLVTLLPVWLGDPGRQIWNIVAWHTQSTTAEELPLLITLGSVSTEIAWLYFALLWYITFIGIGMLIYYWLKHNDSNLFFLLIWTLVMLVPTFAMRRFAYYFAINVAIVSAWSIYLLLSYLTKNKQVQNEH